MLFEDYSLLLLVGHAVAGLCTVALSTHLLFWLRGRRSHRSSRRFALLSAAAFVVTMVLGMALYPTYRVRVRAEYLDNPSAIRRATEQQANAERLARARNQESLRFRRGATSTSVVPPLRDSERDVIATRAEQRATQAAKLARWFDVKEHWSALGLLLAGALTLMLWVSPPSKNSSRMRSGTLALALGATLIAWFAATVGIILTAARSVAGL